MTTNLHDKMLKAIDAYFSISDAVEQEAAENLLHDVRDELLKRLAQPTGACAMCGALQGDQIIKQPRAEGTLAQHDPVAWGWAIMHSDGTTAYIRARVEDFFGAIQERESFTEEDVKQADREWAGLVPHSIATLYTAHGITSGEATKKGN